MEKLKDTKGDGKFCRFVPFNNNKSFRGSFVIRFKMLGKSSFGRRRRILQSRSHSVRRLSIVEVGRGEGARRNGHELKSHSIYHFAGAYTI